tara:strand:- start:3864 stop:4040 length:177 start_codon:yes stop_codon:yes gene_type:complete
MSEMDKKRIIAYTKILKQMKDEIAESDLRDEINISDFISLIGDTVNLIELLENISGDE